MFIYCAIVQLTPLYFEPSISSLCLTIPSLCLSIIFSLSLDPYSMFLDLVSRYLLSVSWSLLSVSRYLGSVSVYLSLSVVLILLLSLCLCLSVSLALCLTYNFQRNLKLVSWMAKWWNCLSTDLHLSRFALNWQCILKLVIGTLRDDLAAKDHNLYLPGLNSL